MSVIKALRVLNGYKLSGSELLVKADEKTQKILDQELEKAKAEAFQSNPGEGELKFENDLNQECLRIRENIGLLIAIRDRGENWKTIDVSAARQKREFKESLSEPSVKLLSDISNGLEAAATTKDIPPAVIIPSSPSSTNVSAVFSSNPSTPTAATPLTPTTSTTPATTLTPLGTSNVTPSAAAAVVIPQEDPEEREKRERQERERESRRREREDREFREREKAWENWERNRDQQRDRQHREVDRAALDERFDDSIRRKKNAREYSKLKYDRQREREDDEYERQRELDRMNNLNNKKRREDATKHNNNNNNNGSSPAHSAASPPAPSATPLITPVTPTTPLAVPSSPRTELPTNGSSNNTNSNNNNPTTPTHGVAAASLVVPTRVEVSLKKAGTTSVTLGSQYEQEMEAEELLAKKKRRLTALDEELDQRNKLERAKSIIENIPTAQDAVFAYEIDWDIVRSQQVVEKKLRPWVAKKIAEYMGEEEKTLIDFILTQIAAALAPTELLNKLLLVLDEDAPDFVLKLWRKLIYEYLAAKLL